METSVDLVYNMHVDKLSREATPTAKVLAMRQTRKKQTVQEVTPSIDDYDRMVYDSVMADAPIDPALQVTTEEMCWEERKKELKEKVISQFKEYEAYWHEDINMEKRLDLFGNKDYFDEKRKETLRREKILKYRDPLYVSGLFDVLKWWAEVGVSSFPELATAAAVLLGKPTHNGFQERVFSRGTYADSNLKKNLTEENFEMKVLNSLNGTEIDDIDSKLTLKRYTKKKVVDNLSDFFNTYGEDDIVDASDINLITTIPDDNDTCSVDAEDVDRDSVSLESQFDEFDELDEVDDIDESMDGQEQLGTVASVEAKTRFAKLFK
jgi:hypothetical protein